MTRAGSYEFSRGSADKKEDSWTAMVRLADEVGWRCYSAGGEIWYVSEPWLARQAARYRITPDSVGLVSGPDFEFDTRRDPAEANLRILAARYALAPGMRIELAGLGTGDGTWLVRSVRQTLGSGLIDLTLGRARPSLPEPAPQAQTVTVETPAGGTSETTFAPGGGQITQAPTDDKARVRVAGAWGGMQSIFTQLIHPFMQRQGLRAGSQKRSATGSIGSSSTSDHHVSQANAYATDYPTYNGAAAAAACARMLGVPHVPNTYTSGHTTIGGVRVRVQILWGAAIRHGDHVHVGCRRA